MSKAAYRTSTCRVVCIPKVPGGGSVCKRMYKTDVQNLYILRLEVILGDMFFALRT